MRAHYRFAAPVVLSMVVTVSAIAENAGAQVISSSPDGTMVDGIDYPDTCPKRPDPTGPLAHPGLTDLPYNHRAFEGETDEQMFDRHRREADEDYNSPCEKAYRAKLDAAIASGKRRAIVANATAVSARGHEYTHKRGEMYFYGGDSVIGVLLLSASHGRAIFTSALELQPGLYRQQGQYFNCDINGGACEVYSDMGLFPIDPPPADDIRARIVRDAKVGRIKVFSNAQKFLADTPW
jgi:hypothetical protein